MKTLGPCWDGDIIEKELYEIADRDCWGKAAAQQAAKMASDMSLHKFEAIDLGEDAHGPRWIVLKRPEIGDEVCLLLESDGKTMLWCGVIQTMGESGILTTKGYVFVRKSMHSPDWLCRSPRGRLVLAGPMVADLGN